jgi:hypothetical protein
MVTVLMVIVLVALILCIPGIPGYVIAQRRGIANPWVAFLPMFGLWIVLFESLGRSGLLALLMLFQPIAFVFMIWTAIEIPPRHGRSRWWTAVLFVPVLNILAYWVYAFTLPRQGGRLSLQTSTGWVE